MNTETEEIEEVEIEPQSSPINGIEFQKTLPNGNIIIGYRQHDEDCANPCTDQDGMGHIRSFSRRHINNIDRDEAIALLKKDPMVVTLSYFEHGNCLWDITGGPQISGCPDMQWDGVQFAGVWIPDQCCRDEIMSRYIKSLLPEGTRVDYVNKHTADGKAITRKPRKGETSYFHDGTVPVKKYHNNITYFLPDGTSRGGYKSFTTAYLAAAKALGIALDKKAKKGKIHTIARDLAKNCCEEYTSWSNGECYGYIIERFNEKGEFIDEVESVWGFIGDYSKEALEEAFNHVTE